MLVKLKKFEDEIELFAFDSVEFKHFLCGLFDHGLVEC
jgi:hypothetical protein